MQTSKYTVNIEDGKYVLQQNHKNPMDFKEALKTLAKVKQDIMGGEKQIEKQQKEIDTKYHEKALELSKEQFNLIKDLKVKLEESLKAEIDDYTQKVRAEIKVMKAEKGYSRVGDENQKIAMASAILGQVAHNHDLDVAYEFMREIRADFDNI
ncbi:MAG: hypothetical protein Unbinned1693contig1002_10 [Prokaryotic dsDNA virus sp.]|jgi:tyrosyl-tRNA synthetase|nr:MAG: hypothetical protein Unbinned1693contig1002_10 [Prokaryotic dsDNA virus sp.]|tara:strand:+ start:10250 stop:10708 length:459 start_codon:yes stop_codon:yes gene_type:complete